MLRVTKKSAKSLKQCDGVLSWSTRVCVCIISSAVRLWSQIRV
jgi:hypothetical protein